MKTIIFISIALLCLSQAFAATEETTSGVDRYAIYIGSNKGGKGREQLLYAGSDAQNFQKAMSEIGGVIDSNSYVLIDPTKELIDETLDKVSQKISNSQSHAKRSEFIFYYSGHSDENSLLLGDVPYDYSSLKAAITDVPSDIHVVILDSCYSGNFIRTKGGQKRKPFLIDDSSIVTGHAYLSSSSTNEYSQESDEIESSFFTNAMITGLRGAADASGDNKVTLNELYSYAFNDTLSKTESSKAGPQHPNYNITLVGSGDLVLSDISNGEAMLSLSKEAKGKFIIRNAEGKLISEINKVAGQPIFIALPAAQYSAVIIDDYSTKQGYFVLEKDQIYVLNQNSLSSIKRKSNRVRGGSVENDTDDDDEEILPIDDLKERPHGRRGSRRRYENVNDYEDSDSDSDQDSDSKRRTPLGRQKKEDIDIAFDQEFDPLNMNSFHLSAVPGVSIVGFSKESSLFSLGIIGASDKNVFALQASPIMNITSNRLSGIQAGGVFNIAGSVRGLESAGVFNCAGNVNGLQTAGVFNTAKNVNGVQSAGVFNVAKDVNGVQAAGVINVANEVKGAQIGLINYAEKNDGIAIGLINVIKDGMHHFGFYWDSNDMFDISFQSGTKNLFMTIGFAMNRDEMFKYDYSYNKTAIFYAGFGTEFRFGFSSLDLEVLFKGVYNPGFYSDSSYGYSFYDISKFIIPSFRVTFNALSLSHLDLSIGASFDIRNHGVNDTAFLYTSHKWGSIGNKSVVYPSMFIGFKIK